jgi:hypothetical protein
MPQDDRRSESRLPSPALGPEQSEILYQLWIAEAKAFALARSSGLSIESLQKGLTTEELTAALKPTFDNLDKEAVTAHLMSMRHRRWEVLGTAKFDKALKGREVGAKPKRYPLAEDGEIIRRKLTATLALRRYSYGGRESRADLTEAFAKETGLSVQGTTGIDFRINQLLKMGYFNVHPDYPDELTYKDTRIDAELFYLIKLANHSDPLPDRYI